MTESDGDPDIDKHYDELHKHIDRLQHMTRPGSVLHGKVKRDDGDEGWLHDLHKHISDAHEKIDDAHFNHRHSKGGD